MNRWKLVYDGDDTAPVTPPPTPPPASGTKTYTQADIDRIMSEERKKSKTKNDQLVSQLEELKKNTSLSQQQQEELTSQIESLKTEHLTKEEQFKAQHEKDMKKAKTEQETLVKDRDDWRNRFTTSEIRRAIMDAASLEKAKSSKPVIALLQPLTFLAPVIGEDNKPTGDLIPKVKWTEVKDGKTLHLELSVIEAVKRMKENAEYLHLFEGTATGGLGGSSGSGQGGGSFDPNKPPTDPAEFRKWRNQQARRVKT